MQHLENLWGIVNMVGKVRDIAQETRHWSFNVSSPTTFYCHLEGASLIIRHHNKPALLLETQVLVKSGWRIETDDDDAGVYVVARKLPFIGTMSQLTLIATVPSQTNLILKLERCILTIENVADTIRLASVFASSV